MSDADIELVRGDHRAIDVAVLAADGVSPLNLTGAELRWTAKRSHRTAYADADIAKSSLDGGIVVDDAAAGLARILLQPADTSSLPPVALRLYYDLQLTDSGGEVSTVASGIVVVRPDVTNA